VIRWIVGGGYFDAVGGEEDDADGHAEDASQDRDASDGGTSSGGDGSTTVGELSRRERLRAARATDRRSWGGRSMSFYDLEPPIGREGEEASTTESGARATECHSSQGEGGLFRELSDLSGSRRRPDRGRGVAERRTASRRCWGKIPPRTPKAAT